MIWLTRVTSLLSHIKNLVTLKLLPIAQHNVCFLYVNGLKQSLVKLSCLKKTFVQLPKKSSLLVVVLNTALLENSTHRKVKKLMMFCFCK